VSKEFLRALSDAFGFRGPGRAQIVQGGVLDARFLRGGLERGIEAVRSPRLAAAGAKDVQTGDAGL
jgi:hypothetical protein